MTTHTRHPSIVFYFDYISSNAYLAWHALLPLAARYEVCVEPVAVLFAALLERHGQLGPAEIPAKALWTWKNNLRKAALLGVPLAPPAYHPFNPLLALRVSSLPMAADDRTRLVTALFDAVWARQEHVSDAAVVERVAVEVGLDGGRLVAAAATGEAKGRLRAQTDAAIEAGVFGVPSMRVGTDVFWGYDDLPFLERALAGTDPLDADQLARGAGRPRASAVRRRFRGERGR